MWPLAALILIAAGLWIYNTIEQRPKVQTTFWDIRIGATEGDVKFLKGSPSDGPINKDRDEWVYVFEGSTLRDRATNEWDSIYRIRFKGGKVYLVEYRTRPNRAYGPGIQGIDIGDSLETITQKFGPPSHVSVSKDELSRVFSFNKYQVVFELKENRVFGYGVFDTTIAPKGVGYADDEDRAQKKK